jgi:hypothetical protein
LAPTWARREGRAFAHPTCCVDFMKKLTRAVSRSGWHTQFAVIARLDWAIQ